MASKNRSVVITVIAVAVIVILCVTYSSVELHLTNGFGDRDRNEGGQSGGASRLDRYCNIEIPNRQLLNHSLKENWTLQYLAINIRHGDRSAIHRMPGTTTFIDSSLPSQTPLDNKTTIYIEKLKAFHLSALPGSRKRYNFEKNEEKDLKSVLNPKKTLQKATTALARGQLTTRGFLQHIELGKQLHRAYGSSFLSKLPASQMYVRSTNYARTIQSVSALLITLMPHLHNWKRKIPIRCFSNEEDEIMHGLGVRSSSHSNTSDAAEEREEQAGTSNGETIYSGGCAASVRLAAEQEKLFTADHSLRAELVDRVGNQLQDKPVGHMADALLPSFCHAQPLPCSAVEDKVKQGTSSGEGVVLGAFLRSRESPAATSAHPSGGKHCLNQNDLSMIMAEADRHYCERFAGQQGGLHSTQLSIYPFLREVTEHLATASLQGPLKKEKLSIFSGHDTVIAPVLAGLGVYAGELCIWPGYASNIVIELWHPSKGNSAAATADTFAGPSPSLQKLFPGLWEEVKPTRPSSYASSFVRVVFNGVDITQRIPTCAAERAAGTESGSTAPLSSLIAGSPTTAQVAAGVTRGLLTQAVKGGHTLCSLDALVAQVAGLIQPHGTIEEACSA